MLYRTVVLVIAYKIDKNLTIRIVGIELFKREPLEQTAFENFSGNFSTMHEVIIALTIYERASTTEPVITN